MKYYLCDFQNDFNSFVMLFQSFHRKSLLKSDLNHTIVLPNFNIIGLN